MDVWLIVTIAGAVPLFGYSICQWYFIFRDRRKGIQQQDQKKRNNTEYRGSPMRSAMTAPAAHIAENVKTLILIPTLSSTTVAHP